MRIAAIGDFHMRVSTQGMVKELLKDVEQHADVLVITGDLTDNGLPEEAEALLEELNDLNLPKVGVLGNHDHENDCADTLTKIFTEGGINMLDATAFEYQDVGFVGTKGFCGGFETLLVQPFGERALKAFIETSVDEALRFENALAKLTCPHRIAVLHYAPIKDTLIGEPAELFPFLGTSRLENVLDRQNVEVAFHGHAHHGSPEGKTRGGVPVHNVSRFVQTEYNHHSYCLYELPV